VHLVGYFHSWITMHGFLNVKLFTYHRVLLQTWISFLKYSSRFKISLSVNASICHVQKPTPSLGYNRDAASFILIFGTRWRREASFTLRPLYRQKRGTRYTLREFWVSEPVCRFASDGKRIANSFVFQYTDHAIWLPHKREESEQKSPYMVNMISELP
jgi:hypothetical protein